MAVSNVLDRSASVLHRSRRARGMAWKAGSPHPKAPHVRADRTEGNWSPEPGYRWINPESDAFDVA